MTDLIHSEEQPVEILKTTTAEQLPEESPSSRFRRRRLVWVGSTAIIAVLALVLLANNDSPTEVNAAPSLNFADVVRTDLVEQETFDGTLGSVEDDPIVTQIGGTITAIAAPGGTVAQGESLFSVDGEPVVLLYGDLPAFRDIALAEDVVTVSNRLSGTITWTAEPGTVIEQGDVLYTVDDQPVVVLYGDQPAYRRLYDASTNLTGLDVLQLEEALVGLGYDADATMTVDDEFTFATGQIVEDWQEALGAEVDGSVDLGEVVFLPGPSQVVDVLVTPGDQAGGAVLTIATGDPSSGSDVLNLEEALVALGFDAEGALIADGIYTSETTQGVLAFQIASGMKTDGVINLGEVVFLPNAVRITSQVTAAGSRVNEGAGVLGISSSDKVVRMDLPASQQGLLVAGDSVIVELPDFTEVPATVISVSQTATRAADGPATFEVFVHLDDPTPAEGLDEAPVEIIVVSDSVEDVVAIPVSALVALLEGGYGVEVDTGDGTVQLIAVDVGFFADGFVEVTSATLEPGDLVVVP